MGNCMCMGGQNRSSNGQPGRPGVKVVLAGGVVEEFKRPVTVAELTLAHPHHLLCHSSALTSLSKRSVLPADLQLEPGRLYYLLPSHKFKDSVSPSKKGKDSNGEENSHEATGHVKNAHLAKKTDSEPFQIQHWKGPGIAQVTVRGQDVTKLFSDKHRPNVADMSYSTPDLRSLYAAGPPQVTLDRCNSWKPRLETIHEVGVLSKKRIENFVRGRGSKSKVHSHLVSN